MNTAVADQAEQRRHHIDTYLKSLEPMMTLLRPAERKELHRELSDHLQTSAASLEGSADRQVAQAVENLGRPQTFLPDLVEEIRTQRSVRRGSPLHAMQLLGRNLGHGLLRSVGMLTCASAMLLALLLAIGGVSAWLIPDAGLYWNSWTDWSLSFEQQELGRKIDDAWFAPLAVMAAVALYMLAARAMLLLAGTGLPRS